MKKYQAPRYRDQYKIQKKRRFEKKVLLFFGVSVVAAAAVIYVLFFAHLFDVRRIDIEGAVTVSAADMTATADRWLNTGHLHISRRSNIILLTTGSLRSELINQYPKIATLTIEKHPFHRLAIRITERKPVGIWCLAPKSECFFFDDEQKVYEVAPSTSGSLVLEIEDDRDGDLVLGQRLAADDFIEKILIAREALSNTQFSANKFTIPNGSFDEFDATTSYGWPIMFDKNGDIKGQIEALAGFSKEKLSADQIAKLQYMDLRIDGRLYYK